MEFQDFSMPHGILSLQIIFTLSQTTVSQYRPVLYEDFHSTAFQTFHPRES